MKEGRASTTGLQGKTVIVTGGAGAIGTSTARRLATARAKVAIVDVRGDAAPRLVDSFRENGGEAEAFTVDLTSEDEIGALVDRVLQRFGQIDILHNNAGGMMEDGRTLLELSAMISRTMLQRFTLPEDIAAVVLFLVSDEARQVTGELVRVDGGRP